MTLWARTCVYSGLPGLGITVFQLSDEGCDAAPHYLLLPSDREVAVKLEPYPCFFTPPETLMHAKRH